MIARGDDLVLALFLVLAGASMLATCGADAQRAAAATSEETLAAICVHEAGFDSPGDCWGIFAVLANAAERARVSSWLRALPWHSGQFVRGTGAHPWARALRDSDDAPDGMAASWTRARITASGARLPSRRDRFRDLVALAYEIIRSPIVCAATAWGNEADYTTGRFAVHHARDVFVDCRGSAEGPTRNRFSHAPTRER